jgi:flavin reductase (DIM6/NTAB) family NADH-FMN oxidoreductase RutF
MKFDIANLDWKESHELMAAAVVPRPIALISTVGQNGVFNVAPYSFYGVASVKPAIVFVGIGVKVRARQMKDTIRNIEFSKDFVINVVDETLTEPMNQSSADYPSDVSEFEEVGLTPVKSDLVIAPRVRESPVGMECQLRQIMKFGEFPHSTDVVIGEVLRVHVRDDLWVNGAVQMFRLKVVARLGGELFCRTSDIFEMKRPYALGQ